jgi:hypothetical protein
MYYCIDTMLLKNFLDVLEVIDVSPLEVHVSQSVQRFQMPLHQIVQNYQFLRRTTPRVVPYEVTADITGTSRDKNH